MAWEGGGFQVSVLTTKSVKIQGCVAKPDTLKHELLLLNPVHLDPENSFLFPRNQAR